MSRIDLPGYGIETAPSYPPSPACVVCRGDCVPLNDAGECAECAPQEDETCEAWMDRVKARQGTAGTGAAWHGTGSNGTTKGR